LALDPRRGVVAAPAPLTTQKNAAPNIDHFESSTPATAERILVAAKSVG